MEDMKSEVCAGMDRESRYCSCPWAERKVAGLVSGKSKSRPNEGFWFMGTRTPCCLGGLDAEDLSHEVEELSLR